MSIKCAKVATTSSREKMTHKMCVWNEAVLNYMPVQFNILNGMNHLVIWYDMMCVACKVGCCVFIDLTYDSHINISFCILKNGVHKYMKSYNMQFYSFY